MRDIGKWIAFTQCPDCQNIKVRNVGNEFDICKTTMSLCLYCRDKRIGALHCITGDKEYCAHIKSGMLERVGEDEPGKGYWTTKL